MAFKLLLLAVVIVAHTCMANEACDECDDVTEICVKEGDFTACQCRPSLFRDAESGFCEATKSYTTTADLVSSQWEEIPEGSEEYINLSSQVCEDFNNTLATSEQFETFYYGCDVVAFTESDDGFTHGVVVLSLFKVTLNDSYVDELNSVLSAGLPSDTYDTITTTATNECELNIQDCDVLADCRDTGSLGFTCSCIDSTDDESPEGLPGRDCAIRTHMYIVGISVGASLVFFLIVVSIVSCVSTHTTLGKTPTEIEEERKAKSGKKPSDTDETPLDPRGDGGGREGGEEVEGVTNGGFEEAQVPETIFDVDDDQMARLAQIHLAIERNSRPASGVPVARENNQMRLSRLPSTNYGGPEGQNAALYQNGVNKKPRNERTSLVRLPSGEYLTPMSPREMSPPPPQNPYGVRNKQRPQSAAYTDEMNNQIYATRLPSTKYDQRTAASPPPTPAPEPYLSRQSSSVFLPNSPRNSRQYGGGSIYSYNGRY
ncbi:uncharacterized protein [Apostichopus japonicus]|uniref:uncharacterized protein isoform X2 n=1 Tax=Stichopus japonicus TaxID=307972 RepID=UPI003AB870B3